MRARTRFFLDGFAPSKNADMWSDKLLAQIQRLAAPGSTAATYTVAGLVRRGLETAGFVTEKKPGFAAKREMLSARFRGHAAKEKTVNKVTVIGAGIAGAACAYALARRGVQVEVIDRETRAGAATSSNPAAVVRPFVTRENGWRDRFAWSAFTYAARLYGQLDQGSEDLWRQSGVLQLGRDPLRLARLVFALRDQALVPELVQVVDATVAGSLIGTPVHEPAIWYPGGGLAFGTPMCNALLMAGGGALRFMRGVTVREIRSNGGTVDVIAADDHVVSSERAVVVANGAGAPALLERRVGTLQLIRGQVTGVTARVSELRAPVCRDGYVTPVSGGHHFIGGTFDRSSSETRLTDSDHNENLLRAAQILPDVFATPQVTPDMGWAGVRVATRDRLPLAGSIDDGIYCCAAMGSRGFSWAPLTAEIVASAITGAPCPVERSVSERLLPRRFTTKSANMKAETTETE